MMKKLTLAILAVMLLIAAGQVLAQETKGKEAPAMPPMGPPEEMKQLAPLVGTWDFAMKMIMNPTDTNWMDSKGTTTYEMAYGGAALRSIIEEPMMGQSFWGGELTCYNRETKKWQSVWVDNMSAKLTMFAGTKTPDGMILEGQEMVNGVPTLNRMTSYNMTPTTFDWKGEMSVDNGKTWITWATAKYTKRK